MSEPVTPEKKNTKSTHAEREERILASWKEKGIFAKTLNKDAPQGEFTFFEGPPTANGMPGIHHLEARAFKDAIPRYKTMQGFHVRRKGGWDTHGLPVELQVEKELGLKSKKEIEVYGIEKFNEKCKESVWRYVGEWEKFTDRMGYWVDLKDPYVTYRPNYIESLWNIVKTVEQKKLLYKDYKVVPWCPRCGTGLSSHELAQGYETVKDLSVYVKFKIQDPRFKNTFLLAWTTTPWTLPGNVGLAVGNDVEYVQIVIPVKTGIQDQTADARVILAKTRLSLIKESYQIEKEFKGSDLVGLEYEPLYPFLKDGVTGTEKDKLSNAFKVYAGDFVTTEDGTGIVHIAPMYGQDDFELGTKVGLPKYHLVNDDGTFKSEAGFLAGKFVKSEEVAVEIIKNLALRPEGSLLFHKEKHEHTYPHCWRCKTPLIYFARDSWYIRMSELRDKLVTENTEIAWEPAHIGQGRFGEWLREVKDWAISRERYWGTPLPVWACTGCDKRQVVGSVAEIAQKPKNTYYVMRHGEAENNVKAILSGKADVPHHLTEKGKTQVTVAAEALKKEKFDMIYVSPFVRTQESAEILRSTWGLDKGAMHTDERLRELGTGSADGTSVSDFVKGFKGHDRFTQAPEGGETFADIKKRMGDFLYDMERTHEGKKILIVTHETPAFLLFAAAKGWNRSESMHMRKDVDFIHNAQFHVLDFSILPHNHEYELDLHRPYIDEVTLTCSCGSPMKRVKEVMDVWFDSGAMPFAQDHYPFENKDRIDGKLLGIKKATNYPADFISEAIDQTRGWFYTLHAIGALMGKGKAFKNVICLGHILDAEGKKMSKSIGNVVNPWDMMDLYGADALRFWMYSVNQPGESKNFDQKTVDEIIKKVFNLVTNVTTFYKMYEGTRNNSTKEQLNNSSHVLDKWIVSKLDELVGHVTTGLDAYVLLEPTRAIRDFIADLSQWYVRRSRDRFKDGGEDARHALETTHYVLVTLAKVMAPFTPFFAEYLYQEVGGDKESVHLEQWPVAGIVDKNLITDMQTVRDLASRGLEARMKSKINVRQPLQTLKVRKEISLTPELVELVKDEVNVKEVKTDTSIAQDVELDITITPSLKEEGDLRELIRKIQDARKEKNLSVNDVAILTLTEEARPLAMKYEQEIKKTTGLSAIEYGEVFSVRI
ncbi:MAG: class I tRNA ligase family protein [Patescibacteria group bacterium]